MDLEWYQNNREQQGASPATQDMELRIAQTAVNKAFENDMIDGHALKAFRATKRKLKFGQTLEAAFYHSINILDYYKQRPHISNQL